MLIRSLVDPTIMKGCVLCSHCGCNGHEKKECWQLVGFPEWWKERAYRGVGERGSGSRGRGGRGGRGRGQIVDAHATSSNSSVFPKFTQDQLKVLAQMIQEK